MIAQAVVAAAAGVLLFSKNLMYKVKAFFGLIKDEDDSFNSIDIDDNESDEQDKQ